MRRQQFGKAPGPATEIDDQRYVRPINMNREQALPEPTRFRCESAGFAIGGRNLGPVVVHRSVILIRISLASQGELEKHRNPERAR